MTRPSGLRIDGELTLQIEDGAGRSTIGRLGTRAAPGSAGDVIEVRLDDPAVAMRALPTATGWRSRRRALAAVADVIGAGGVRLDVRNRTNTVVAFIDPTRSGRMEGYLSGSRYLVLGPAAPQVVIRTMVAAVAALRIRTRKPSSG